MNGGSWGSLWPHPKKYSTEEDMHNINILSNDPIMEHLTALIINE